MLRPTKHLNPKVSVLNASALMLSALSKRRTMQYAELFRVIEKRLGSGAEPVFGGALSFLFLLGKLEYHSKTDAFEFLDAGDSK